MWIRYPDTHPTVAAARQIDRREAIFRWDNHLKAQHQPLSQSGCDARLVYLPFWRISAMVAYRYAESLMRADDRISPVVGLGLACDHDGFPGDDKQCHGSLRSTWDIKPWDLSFPAFHDGLWGLDSLGVRTQTVALGGCADSSFSDPVHWWPPSGREEDAIPRLSETITAVSAQTDRSHTVTHRIIAPRISLIYWPVWVLADGGAGSNRCAEIDAVSGRIVRDAGSTPQLPEQCCAIDGEAPALLPHRCPSCGSDLRADAELAAFPCPNCGVVVAHVGSGDRRILASEFSADPAAGDFAWYPFWLLELGQILVPAFAIRNFRLLLRFGNLVSAHGRTFSESDNPPARLAGVALSSDVAVGLAELIRDAKSESPRPLDECLTRPLGVDDPAQSASPVTPRLVFLPLSSRNGELTDPATGLCLSQAALAAH